MDIQKILYLPELASAHGADLDRLNWYVHLLMGVLFVGWSVYFVLALVKFRASAHPVANPDGVQSHASSYIEVAVVVAEAVLLLGFSVPLWAARVDQFPPEDKATRVRVVGQQFAWNVHYPGPDGKFGKTDIKLVDAQSNPLGLDKSDPDGKDDFTTVNQLHLPVNTPAIIYLSSLDVIHSFGVPREAGRHPRHGDARLVPADRHQRRHEEAQGRRQVELRDRLCAAVRPRPLSHARVRHGRHARRVREVDGGAAGVGQGIGGRRRLGVDSFSAAVALRRRRSGNADGGGLVVGAYGAGACGRRVAGRRWP